MSQFSGNYLYDNNLSNNILEIRFSQPLGSISLTFATADFHQNEVPTTIQLTAYLDTNGATTGSATAHGTYASDTMPMGTLTFNAGGAQFNLVRISIPFQALAASDFLVDNIKVTPLASAFTSVSAASFAGGAPLAPGSIASAFGQGLASRSEQAALQPPPLTLAGTSLKVKDSTGAERPAPLFYVSPTQINYLVPEGTSAGPATVTASNTELQVSTAGTVVIDAVAPGVFTANFDGQGAPAGAAITVAPDLTQTVQAVALCGASAGSCVTAPIDLGPSGTAVVLTLYGTGIRGRRSLAGVTALIGGVDAQVLYAGAQPEFAGLDQANVLVPRSLAGRGETDLALTVDGKAANLVRVNIR